MLLPGCATCTLTHIIGTRNNLQETPKIPKGEIFSRFVNPKLWRKKASPCFLPSQSCIARVDMRCTLNIFTQIFAYFFCAGHFGFIQLMEEYPIPIERQKGEREFSKSCLCTKNVLISFIWFKIFFSTQRCVEGVGVQNQPLWKASWIWVHASETSWRHIMKV